MAVDDNYREAIRKSAQEVTAGDNTKYKLRTFFTDAQVQELANKINQVSATGDERKAIVGIYNYLSKIDKTMQEIRDILKEGFDYE